MTDDNTYSETMRMDGKFWNWLTADTDMEFSRSVCFCIVCYVFDGLGSSSNPGKNEKVGIEKFTKGWWYSTAYKFFL